MCVGVCLCVGAGGRSGVGEHTDAMNLLVTFGRELQGGGGGGGQRKIVVHQYTWY